MLFNKKSSMKRCRLQDSITSINAFSGTLEYYQLADAKFRHGSVRASTSILGFCRLTGVQNQGGSLVDVCISHKVRLLLNGCASCPLGRGYPTLNPLGVVFRDQCIYYWDASAIPVSPVYPSFEGQ